MKRAGSIIFIVGCIALGAPGCRETPVAPAPPKGAPSVVIEEPPFAPGDPQYAKVTHFIWNAGEGAEPVAIRRLWSLVADTDGVYNPGFDIIGDLNANPRRYESAWTPWIAFNAPGDSGRSTVLGDDEKLSAGKYYIFAVQARDRRGIVTGSFSTRTNARRFRVGASATPLVTIYEQYLAGFKFLGTNFFPQQRDIPPGIPLRFRWSADVSSYGGEIAGYRYAWDVLDPSAWSDPFVHDLTEASEVTFYAGVHTLFIEAVDIAGTHTLARITLSIVPCPMDRDLLFVDDYYLTNTPVPDYSNPTKSAHDAFWLGICSRARGFDPARDVYDCIRNQLISPGLPVIGKYRNIIWTYSADTNVWSTMVAFTPESSVGQSGKAPNYLAMFILRGGHLWTLGQGQRGGALAACLTRLAQSFPMNLACEITGNRADCAGDRSGVESMPYRDYCVTVLDKVDGVIRGSEGMPERIRDHYDVLSYALRDEADPLTAAHPGLPSRLDLWEEVTKKGRYFDPADSLGPGGLTYVEVYDPAYWMTRNSLQSQSCFHPLYRMRAASDHSALNDCAVALWVAKYDDVVPDVMGGGGVAAASFHFGFPLWFFKRSSVDSIVTVVFNEWGILKQ